MVRISFNRHYCHDEDSSSKWSLWESYKIMPTLEDLHQAIRIQDARKVRFLTEHSLININSSLRSCTALSLAVYQRDLDIVKVLLENGANPNKLSRDWNDRIETPLFSACRLGLGEVAKSLIKAGADVNATDFYNHSPLWIATRERDLGMVLVLIQAGADLNIADKWSQCPLYLATKYMGRSEIAKALIQHGCKLDLTDMEGHGALYWALANHQVDIVKLLIFAGAHVNIKDRDFMIGRCKSTEIRDDVAFGHWLQHELKNPPSAMRLATTHVRHRFCKLSGGKSIWPAIDRLPIPEHTKDYLKFKNW